MNSFSLTHLLERPKTGIPCRLPKKSGRTRFATKVDVMPARLLNSGLLQHIVAFKDRIIARDHHGRPRNKAAAFLIKKKASTCDTQSAIAGGNVVFFDELSHRVR
jgi:hypothetical protein